MKEKDKKIFIQIASYRDPELIKTLDSLFDNASNPGCLRVCIAWQHSKEDEWDNLGKYLKHPQIKVLDIDYKESKGVCWARNQIQQHYNDEEYTLQLDSHHRFIERWDFELKKMITGLIKKGHKKPLITGYIPSYFPDTEFKTNEVWKMDFDRFTPEGYIFTRPSTIENWENLKEPVPARFYSAHFAFTLGAFSKEVQHDPLMYFHGEEPSIAVRAFTFGYDLFHPHKIIAWHEYTREGKTKQWDDDKEWGEKDKISHYRYRRLHGMDGLPCTPCALKELRPYVFGGERTLEDYEKYAGVRFLDRGVKQYTLDKKYPPNPEGEDYLFFFKHCIDIHRNDIPYLDYDFWVVSFEKEDGTVIYRQDADENEVKEILKRLNKHDWINIWREYQGEIPDKYVVWFHSKSEGWGKRIEKFLKDI